MINCTLHLKVSLRVSLGHKRAQNWIGFPLDKIGLHVRSLFVSELTDGLFCDGLYAFYRVSLTSFLVLWGLSVSTYGVNKDDKIKMTLCSTSYLFFRFLCIYCFGTIILRFWLLNQRIFLSIYPKTVATHGMQRFAMCLQGGGGDRCKTDSHCESSSVNCSSRDRSVL